MSSARNAKSAPSLAPMVLMIWSLRLILPLILIGGTGGQVLAKEIIPTPADTPVLGELEPVLIDVLLKNNKDPDASLATVRKNPKLRAMLAKHKIKLFGGPMLGSVTHNSARIWVRTPDEAQVQIVASKESKSGKLIQSKKLKTAVASDLTAVLELTGLEPFTIYRYDVLVVAANSGSPFVRPLYSNERRRHCSEFSSGR